MWKGRADRAPPYYPADRTCSCPHCYSTNHRPQQQETSGIPSRKSFYSLKIPGFRDNNDVTKGKCVKTKLSSFIRTFVYSLIFLSREACLTNMFAFVILLACVLYAAAASPTLGIEFASAANQLPTLTLPYGTWRAASYDSTNDVSDEYFISYQSTRDSLS